MPGHEKRHLTTILVAYVAGYSGLMAVAEDRRVTYRIGDGSPRRPPQA